MTVTTKQIPMDAVLGEVAVDDGDAISFYIMQVACHEHRERRLACPSFLGGECHILGFFHTFIDLIDDVVDNSYLFIFILIPYFT